MADLSAIWKTALSGKLAHIGLLATLSKLPFLILLTDPPPRLTSTLMMEATSTIKTLATICQTTHHHFPEDCSLNILVTWEPQISFWIYSTHIYYVSFLYHTFSQCTYTVISENYSYNGNFCSFTYYRDLSTAAIVQYWKLLQLNRAHNFRGMLCRKSKTGEAYVRLQTMKSKVKVLSYLQSDGKLNSDKNIRVYRGLSLRS
jgi:hypothetical protein